MSESNQNGFEGDTSGRSASQLAAESVEELIDRRQVQSIFDARDSVRNVLSRGAEIQAEHPRITDERIDGVLTQAVRGYLLELEQLLYQASKTDDDDVPLLNLDVDYWEGVELGELIVHAPDGELYRQADEYGGEIVECRNPATANDGPGYQPVHYQFLGLKSILSADPPWYFTWGGKVERRHGGETVVEHTIKRGMPRRVLIRAHRAANRFCADIGLGLEIAERAEEIGFEYADILENPEEYR